MTSLTLIGKPGCHLCDDARAVLTSVLGEFDGLTFDELSIFDDASLAEQYSEEIPVVLINGRVHAIWRLDADRLRTALEEASR